MSVQTTLRVKIFFTVLSGLIVIALVLFISENYLRLNSDKKMVDLLGQYQLIRIRNLSPNSHPVFTPTRRDVMDSFQLDIKPYLCTTDSFGFIVTNRNHAQADLKFAFFGGSTTQCLYVDEDKRMAEAVRNVVEDSTGLKINVWNCAAGGTHSNHTLNVLNNLAVELAPDYAFFYGNVNDIATLIHYGTYNNRNPEKGIFFSLDEYQKRNGVSANEFLPYTREALRNKFHAKPERDDFADIRGRHFIVDSARVMGPIARIYRTIIASCKANHIKPVLITERDNFVSLDYKWIMKNLPFFGPSEDDYDGVRKLFPQYNNLLRQIAKEEDIMLIDLDGVSFTRDEYYDAVHFNSKGSVKVSEAIAGQFIRLANMGRQSHR